MIYDKLLNSAIRRSFYFIFKQVLRLFLFIAGFKMQTGEISTPKMKDIIFQFKNF